MPYNEKPKWIITCNFNEFRIYNQNDADPEKNVRVLKLTDLSREYYQLDFLVDITNQRIEKEKQVSLGAGELVGKIYNALLKQYHDPDSEYTKKSINQLCVRLVFCLYAEDSGIFGKKNMFHDYLAEFSAREMRMALVRLFKVLDQKIEDRDEYLADDFPKLAQFPYVNGGMFSNEKIEIPPFTEELRSLLLHDASENFDWSEISPTIFGAVFESTLNPETRRSGGMHYTSVENIHKVIDPLFLNDLKEELNKIKRLIQPKTIKREAIDFQTKLASLKFLDPACGSGNFLTETYLQIRKLENEAIKLQIGDNPILDTGQNLIQVSIQQFYGIEINDFAVSVAKTALWIAESQMMEETKEIIYFEDDFLPLKTYSNIIEGNALTLNWDDVLPNYQCSYIMGNPPFVANNARSSKNERSSFASMTEEQKEDRKKIFGNSGKILDYVACWFKLSSTYMKDSLIKCAFVSTDSITQGNQAVELWQNLFNEGIKINFAYKSFKWNSEANSSGTVYVVIIGFSYVMETKKYLYYSNKRKIVNNINGYLKDSDNVFISARSKPLNTDLIMKRGSQPTDGGNLILSESEAKNLCKKYSEIRQYIRRFLMGDDFINNKVRYCLWLKNASPEIIKKFPEVLKRVKAVKEYREGSKKAATRKKAAVPYLFDEIKDCSTDFIAVPIVSSGDRKYIPIGYLSKNVIAGNKLFEVEGASLYDFGILTSIVHMAWVRETCSWYGPSYSYSNTIVYNNFPWPNPNSEIKEKISETSLEILNIRKKHFNSSLADLYDPLSMPQDLIKAHKANDTAVLTAYGIDKNATESEITEKLFNMYEKLTEK